MPQLERNIKAIYENPDLLADASKDNKNLAVDVFSRARVIKLLDGEIKTNGDKIYVPGESYLISFKEAEKTVKSRKKIFLEHINIYPLIIDYIVNELKLQEIYNERQLDMREFEKWMEEKGKKETDSFSQICNNRKNAKGKIDSEDLILVQNLNPITPLTNGYEINDFFYIHDKIGKINLPIEIKAKEAEFSFLSDNHAKISSGDEKIRKYKEGILNLEDACLYVSEIEDNIKKEFWKKNNISSYFWSKAGDVARNVFFSGLFGVAGVLFGGFVGLIIKDEVGIPLITGTIVGGSLGLVTGYLGGKNIGKEEGNEAIMRIKKNAYELKGNSFMRFAFEGKVKDKRFENIEELLI